MVVSGTLRTPFLPIQRIKDATKSGGRWFTWFGPRSIRLIQVGLSVLPHAFTLGSEKDHGVRTDSRDGVTPFIDTWFYLIVREAFWETGHDVALEVGCKFRAESGRWARYRVF